MAIDWLSFHAQIDPIDTADALQTALNDPGQRWYAQRRVHALAASGALLGAFNPLLHPRGHDGKFIERFGWVRWMDPKTLKWRNGWVQDINPTTGELTVRDRGEKLSFPNAKTLYARPKRKAALTLPNVITKSSVDGYKQVGGQGGSNPGALFEIDKGHGLESPDLAGPGMIQALAALDQHHQPSSMMAMPGSIGAAETMMAPDVNVVSVPRIDGTKGRYDVLYRMGSNWYRVPANGQMTEDDLLRDDLKVSAAEAFGQPGSLRRKAVLDDPDSKAIALGDEFDVDDVAGLIQKTGADLPEIGDRYYIKTMDLPERARNEALANHLYELLGVPVPEVAVGADGTTISSKLLPEKVKFDPNNPAHVAAAQKGFVADAFLANWDAIGQSFDNIQIDPDGNAWRIDAGGALAYRAMGKPKGPAFGKNVGELASLTDKKINPTAGTVYSGISKVDMQEQAKMLQAITPNQLMGLAAEYDLPDMGPTLIARRQSVLDQLGVPHAPPPPPAPQASTTIPDLNPADDIAQVSNPPLVEVDNYANAFASLKTETYNDYGASLSEATRMEWAKNAVYVKSDGDLLTYHSGYNHDPGADVTTFLATNTLNGKIQPIVVNSDSPVLAEYAKNDPSFEALADDLSVQRIMAISDLVAAAKDDTLEQVMSDPSRYTDVDALRTYDLPIPNWASFLEAWDHHALGPESGLDGGTEWPLRIAENQSLWEVAAFNLDGVRLIRRDPGGTAEITITKDQFGSTGPWLRPGNDATAALWTSKFKPDDNANDWNWKGQYSSKDAPDTPAPEPVDDILDWLLSETPDPYLAGKKDQDDGSAVGLDPTPEPTVEAEEQVTTGLKTADADLEALLQQEEDNAQAWAAAEPTTSVKTNGTVVSALGPGESSLSNEWAVSDYEQIKADLLGKYVVVLPIDAHDNPDYQGTDLGTSNGLGTVTNVEIKKGGQYIAGYTDPTGAYISGTYQDAVQAFVAWPNGGGTYVWGGKSKFPKVVTPVETEPVAQVPTFKKDGTIVVNGTVVGHHTKPYEGGSYQDPGYYDHTITINGDHSVTGKPLQAQNYKQAQVKKAVGPLLVPVLPKPTKPKSTKITATEDDIKKLNTNLDDLAAQIAGVQTQIEIAQTPEPTGVPMADGTQPKIGDWVFSTKDGKWGQVAQVAPKFGAKNKADPANYVRVKFVIDGKPVSINRTRATLVSAPGPGEQPFVMQTKAIPSSGGEAWIGPGITVAVAGGTGASAGKVIVLDTTPDGNVKYLAPDGSQHWTSNKHVVVLGDIPNLKVPPVKSTATADALNAQLADLQDQHVQLAAVIANTVVGKPKKKKEIGVPYPGPDGFTYKQDASYAEARTAKGLKNTKDNYVPTPGMILRHNDGTQYVVVQMGSESDSHKNSVYVAPISDPSDWKWRSVSTMVVDHDAMLTTPAGDALPIISNIEGVDSTSLPSSGLLMRRKMTKYWDQPIPGEFTTYGSQKTKHRKKETYVHYVVAWDGNVYNLDGSKVSASNIPPYDTERIGYIDKSHKGGQTLTVSVQPHHVAQVGKIEYAVIHDPGDSPAVILNTPDPVDVPDPTPSTPQPTNPTVTPPTPPTPSPVGPAPPGYVYDPAVGTNVPITPPPPGDTPTGDLPAFTGTKPEGLEVPHPATVSSSAGVPVPQPTGGTKLDVAGVPGARSIVTAINEAVSTADRNRQNGTKDWVSTYGLADSDVIEDMMVSTTVAKDAKGDDWIEVGFRVEKDTQDLNQKTFITSAVNEAGDWDYVPRNSKNMVPGDLIAVRVSGGGGATPGGALRPDGDPADPKTPNATVVEAPVLIGKNKAGTYDVWRTKIITAAGDEGWIDLEDRNSADSIAVAVWDPNKPRTTSGALSLNPNAQADGWSLKSSTSLGWDRAQASQNVDERDDAGVKAVGGKSFLTKAGSYTIMGSSSPPGWVMERTLDGATIQYQTSAVKNSNKGRVRIRVRADDPDAQRKISEAMEVVGVTKEKQAPPDKAAITKLAADKVFEQFNPTYTRGMKANSIQDALTAIDNVVGEHMPGKRKATLDDISVRLSPDGRMQFLVSEDVSRAIVKKTGITSYQHSFNADGVEAMVEAITAGTQPGLMSTTERWTHGLFFMGASSAGDHPKDSADHMFLRMNKGTPKASGSNTGWIDAITLHRHLDYYWLTGDGYGERKSDQLNWVNVGTPSGGNEMMLQRRIETSLISKISLSSHTRTAMIKQLHARGITHAPNGQTLEEFFPDGPSPLGPPPSFGTEIPLTALPDNPAAAAAPGTLVTV